MEKYLDKDTIIEILSRLPMESLVAFKCTAKRWYYFVSDPFFLRNYHVKVKGTRGLFLKRNFTQQNSSSDKVDLLTLSETRCAVKEDVLNFLPEKNVLLLSSSNGILYCRGKALQNGYYSIYICNPLTKQWLKVTSKVDFESNVNHIGLAFYPFCSTSMFKLVHIKHITKSDHNDANSYSFEIYSSDTQKWKTCEEVYTFSSRIFSQHKFIFTNGWLNWMTMDNQIIAFHVEKQMCKVIELPFSSDLPYWKGFFGESEGYLHYMYNNCTVFYVWVLKDHEEPVWELKYSLNIVDYYKNVLMADLKSWIPLAYYDNVVYLKIYSSDVSVISYDFKTKNCVFGTHNVGAIVFPYCSSLVPLYDPLSFQLCGSSKLHEE